MVSRGGEKVPALDGRGAHFLDYEHQVHLGMRTARTEIPARASLLISHMRPAPRQACLAAGGDIPDRADGVSKILDILRTYSAPEAVDAIHQQVMRFMRFRRADQWNLIFSSERPSPKWEWGLAFRNNAFRYCVWPTRPYLAMTRHRS